MRSTMSMTLASFGVVFLSFGTVTLILGLLGLRFGYRDALGLPGLIALGFLLLGAVLFGAGWARGKRQ
jgi:hypothetical protein